MSRVVNIFWGTLLAIFAIEVVIVLGIGIYTLIHAIMGLQ